MTVEAFETARLYLVIFTVLLRFALMPIYLQAYLNLAYDRIEELKKEAGRITNTDFQKKITSIFYYLCVVTLQYAAPIIMCLFMAFMYKTLGGYTWNGLWAAPASLDGTCPVGAPPTTTTPLPEVFEEPFTDDVAEESNILTTAKQFQTSLQELKNVRLWMACPCFDPLIYFIRFSDF